MTTCAISIVKTADLDAWQRVLTALCREGDATRAGARMLLVPSRQAGEQFRRTLEHRVLVADEGVPAVLAEALGVPPVPPGGRALLPPRTATRDDWYGLLRATSRLETPIVSPMAREVLMGAAARDVVAAGHAAPFLLRPGLVAELAELHAALQRLGHTRESALAILLPDLEIDASLDRGAARLLVQTRFIWDAFAAYDARLAAAGLADEGAVRDAARAAGDAFADTQVIVAVGDHHASPHGLWPADLDLLASLPLARLDVVCTAREAATGLERRLHRRWPAARIVEVPAQRPSATQLETPPGGAPWFTCRDREEELLLAARRVKSAPVAHVGSTAIVYRRPLPYLYLAQRVLGAAGVPFETREALPLAAEPWAAALDVLIDSVLADHTRAALVAVLRHPLVRVEGADGQPLDQEAVLAFDRLLARDRYLGGAARLAELAARWREGRTSGARRDVPAALLAADAALRLLDKLAPLEARAPGAAHLGVLALTLDVRGTSLEGDDEASARARRARAGVSLVIDALREAYEAHDPHPVAARDVSAVLRRWLEGRTFAPQQEGHGVQLLDVDAARFLLCDRMRLVGLVDGEWPEASARNVFFPAFLLSRLGWADERARTAATRAAFADLLTLPAVAVGVSVPELEQDAVVRPSALLDELAGFGLETRWPVPAAERSVPVTPDAAMLLSPLPVSAVEGRSLDTRAWLEWRLTRGVAPPAGQTAPLGERRHSVTAIERYQQCPFQYFASSVLALEEEPEDETGLPSRDAGLFVHDVLHDCYAAWQARGGAAIGVGDLDAARAVFAEVAERALGRLPAPDRALERLRLFGSAVSTGLLEKVLRVEVAAFGDVASRRLEVPVDGSVTVETTDGRTRRVALAGRIDRLDRTIDGGIRIVDYKSGRRPQQAGLQPSVYALAVLQHEMDLGRQAHVAPSGYVALREVSPWVAVVRDTAAAREHGRVFGEAVAAVEGGEFPVRPVNVFRCRFCDFGSVCRKDYVGDD